MVKTYIMTLQKGPTSDVTKMNSGRRSYDTLTREPCAFIKRERVMEEGRTLEDGPFTFVGDQKGEVICRIGEGRRRHDGRTSMRRRRSRGNLRER